MPYKSNTNPHAERAWGVLLRPVRIIANSQSNGERWWPFIMNQVRIIHNSLPTKGHTPPVAPLLMARPQNGTPDISMMRVMLCRCIARITHLPEHLRTHKLSPHGYEALYLGLDERRRGHLVYVLELNRIETVASKEVRFFERDKPLMQLEGPRAIHLNIGDWRKELPEPSTVLYDPPALPDRPPRSGGARATQDGGAQQANMPALHPAHNVPHDVIARNLQDASFADVAICSSSLVEHAYAVPVTRIESVPLPTSYNEAVNSQYAKEWRDAMQEDLAGKARNGMTELVDHDGKEPLMKGK